MPLQSSGQISLNDLHVEVGGTSGTECSMNDSDIRGLIGLSSANQAAMNAFYGASAASAITTLVGNNGYTPASGYFVAYYAVADSNVYNYPFASYNRGTPTTFTLNSRNAQTAIFQYNTAGYYVLIITDTQYGSQGTTAGNQSGHPTNSGWTSVECSGNGNTVTFNRSAANAFVQTSMTYSGSPSNYNQSTAYWRWNSSTNIFPSTDNAAQYTVKITI